MITGNEPKIKLKLKEKVMYSHRDTGKEPVIDVPGVTCLRELTEVQAPAFLAARRVAKRETLTMKRS